MTGGTTRRRLAAGTALLLALTAGACSDPEPEPPAASPTVQPTTPGPEQPDPRRSELRAELVALRATLEAARDALRGARDATDLAVARAAAEDAVHALTLHPAWSGDLDGDGEVRTLEVTPLLPGPADAIEEDAFYGDQFARTLTAARDAGSAGSPVVDALRDPIVGDLGIWQADAGGVFELVDQAASQDDLEDVEAGLTDIPGSAAKALTYALRSLRSSDLATANQAAERALAHLDLTISSLDGLAPTD